VLSRELCEALAAAYPNIHGHRLTEGDWVYFNDVPLVDEEPYALNNDPDEIAEAQRRGLWCPRLDQLLDLAEQRACCLHLHTHCCGHRWGCHDCADRDGRHGGHGHGDIPEEAVARWLLAVAKEAKALGDPS